jgi:hypothetical protein
LLRFPAVERFEDLAKAAPKKIYTKADGLFADEVFRLFEDSRGDIWFSVISPVKDTLMRWERKTDKIYGYKNADGLPDGNAATAFGEDRAGNVWLGFYSGGAARYRNGKFLLFSARNNFPTGLVNSIYSDRGGRLWIATSNSGVIRFDNPDEDEPQYTVLNVGNGLSSNQANCITEDNFGRVYITTGRGINRIEPETGRIKLYTQADGLPGSSIGALRTFVFGVTGDKPVMADFDGDGATDVAVTRLVDGDIVWHVLKSGFDAQPNATYSQYEAVSFGGGSDTPAAEDFDGDGKTDYAVFRQVSGTWYILRSSTNQVQTTQFGQLLDKPQPADYDGDGKADLAVYRPSSGNWYFWYSISNEQKFVHWGVSSDIPVSSMNTLSQ